MPLFKQWKEGDALWGIWKVTESPEELHAMLTEASCVPDELKQYKSPGRQMEYLTVRVLLSALMGREYRIAHFPSGKPFLPDASFHLSVSHTKGYVAVGLHPTKEIGIDIEQVAERVRKVTSRFVRTDELPGWDNLASTDQLYELLLVWSAKESLFKIMNTSEVDFLEHLKVDPFFLQPDALGSECICKGVFNGHEYRTAERKSYEIHYLTHADFVCTYIIA